MLGDIDEKVNFLSYAMTRDEGYWENDIHCNLLGSAGTPLDGLNRGSLE